MARKPKRLNPPEQDIIRRIWWGCVGTFCLLCLAALVAAPGKAALSVAAGGAIALANFRLLKWCITNALQPQKQAAVGRVLITYYLKFGATAVAVYLLISKQMVEPIGLLVGLSVVVFTMFGLALTMARKLIGKEAG